MDRVDRLISFAVLSALGAACGGSQQHPAESERTRVDVVAAFEKMGLSGPSYADVPPDRHTTFVPARATEDSGVTLEIDARDERFVFPMPRGPRVFEDAAQLLDFVRKLRRADR